MISILYLELKYIWPELHGVVHDCAMASSPNRNDTTHFSTAVAQ